jgi:hypothetical protein
VANIFLGFPNRIDAATLSGGSWEAALPLNNLKDGALSLVARSTDDANASTKFDLDLGTAYSVRTVALVNHNLSAAAQVKVTGGTSGGASDVYDSGWHDAYALVFGADGIEWESDGWWPGAGDDEYIASPWTVFCPMADWKTARYWRVEIDDTANADGYVQIGRVWIGGGLSPQYNASFGLQHGWEDLSQADETISGALAAWVRRRRRTVRLALDWLPAADEALAYELTRKQGVVGEVLYLPDPGDWQASQRYGMLGRLRALSPLEARVTLLAGGTFEIVELV